MQQSQAISTIRGRMEVHPVQAGANAASQEGCKEVGLNICSAKIAGAEFGQGGKTNRAWVSAAGHPPLRR